MSSRRDFLKTGTMLAASTTLPNWWNLAANAEADKSLTPDLVHLDASIEPIVQLIENTPREKCFEMIVAQLRAGLPYRKFLAALFLAGIRNVNPQPPGFKFHCVFVIHAAHQLSLDAPVNQRLLPLFWALDNFKVSQAKDVEEGDFRLTTVTGSLPSPEKAWDEFHAAMDEWDEGKADRAIVALVRSKGANEIIEGLWQYGARDYRNIGHKAIFVANTWRTLQTIGWQHAEPAMRSLVLGLLDFGKDERVNNYAFEDQSYVVNQQRVQQAIPLLPGNWTGDHSDFTFTLELLGTMETGNTNAACEEAMDALISGHVQAQSVWDAVHLMAGELMMKQPGIYGIHTVTSTNGLHYAYETTASEETRLLLLFQAIGWMCQFRNFMETKPAGLNNANIVQIAPVKIPDDPTEAAREILELTATDRSAAAAKAIAYARMHELPTTLQRAAAELVFTKGTDAHDYKYPAAVFEDYARVSPRWRPQMLATAVYHLRASTQPDSTVMERASEAVGMIN